jgi:hypothetical protein
MHALIRRAVTAFIFWRHRRRVARACPDIAAIPPLARDSRGRWQSTRLARRKAIHDRLKMEIGR